MEPGELQSRGGLFYLPKGEEIPKRYTNKEMDKHRAVPLESYYMMVAEKTPDKAAPEASICRACRKIILDY